MPLIIWVILFANIVSPTLSVPTVYAEPQYDFTSTSTVRAYIHSQATTTPEVADYVASGESGFIYNQRGDTQIICWNPNSSDYGKSVYARGAWQITRCYHPEITDEEADDVIWSTTWALPRLQDRKECIHEWTQCAIYYGKINSSK